MGFIKADKNRMVTEFKRLFQNFIEARIPYYSPLGRWRAYILFILLFLMIFLGLITYIPSSVSAVSEGRSYTFIFMTLAYIIIVYVTVSKRITYLFRAFTACLIIYLVGVLSFYISGLIGSGRIWFLCAIVLSCLLLKKRFIFLFSVAALLAIVIFGRLENFEIVTFSESPRAIWVMTTCTFVLIAALLGVSTYLWFIRAEDTFDKMKGHGVQPMKALPSIGRIDRHVHELHISRLRPAGL
jgi:hypothetical protein